MPTNRDDHKKYLVSLDVYVFAESPEGAVLNLFEMLNTKATRWEYNVVETEGDNRRGCTVIGSFPEREAEVKRNH